MQNVFTQNPQQTRSFARMLLKTVSSVSRVRGAQVLCFSGGLGAGKTTLVQGLAKALGVVQKAKSPTFVLLRKYHIPGGDVPWKNLVHIDAYRLRRAREGAELGLKNIFENSGNLVVVEWPERIKRFLPRDALWVEMRHKGGNHRHIVVKPVSTRVREPGRGSAAGKAAKNKKLPRGPRSNF